MMARRFVALRALSWARGYDLGSLRGNLEASLRNLTALWPSRLKRNRHGTRRSLMNGMVELEPVDDPGSTAGTCFAGAGTVAAWLGAANANAGAGRAAGRQGARGKGRARCCRWFRSASTRSRA